MPEKQSREKVLPLWDHISELSRRVKIWIYSFVIATLFYLAVPSDLSFLQNPFQVYHPIITAILAAIRTRLLPSQYILIGGTVTTPLELIVVGSAVFGFATSIPVLAYEIYKFVDPAIKANEKQSVYPFVTAFSILFLVGGGVRVFRAPAFHILVLSAFLPSSRNIHLHLCGPILQPRFLRHRSVRLCLHHPSLLRPVGQIARSRDEDAYQEPEVCLGLNLGSNSDRLP